MRAQIDDPVRRLVDLVQQACPLTPQVAAEVEQLVRAEFGGQAVYFHRFAWVDRRQRDERVFAGHCQGISARELARAHRISRETVRKIIARMRPRAAPDR